ncbi:MAG: PhnD/SsuA/transferrin family substrate-binding protein, partial [Chloroflexi bacterium]|nr:PhnD/SsuA/transferrin family substrate-binding protein [Chloroflexota bacterium]
MFSGHRVRGALSLVAAGFLVAACAAPGGESGEGGDGGTEVNVAFSHPTLFSTGFPYYVAKEKGFYKDAGLNVDATYTGGGSETVQAVVSGSADIGTETSAPAAVGAYSQGGPIKIVSASTTGLDLLWFAKANGPVQDSADLAGKKVGFSSTGSSSHIGVLALNESLKKQGMAEVQP